MNFVEKPPQHEIISQIISYDHDTIDIILTHDNISQQFLFNPYNIISRYPSPINGFIILRIFLCDSIKLLLSKIPTRLPTREAVSKLASDLWKEVDSKFKERINEINKKYHEMSNAYSIEPSDFIDTFGYISPIDAINVSNQNEVINDFVPNGFSPNSLEQIIFYNQNEIINYFVPYEFAPNFLNQTEIIHDFVP
ncbi:11343_t:CDS:2, partial [Acaulospora morrowiae]